MRTDAGSRQPRLLVSVRNAAEAVAALAGGADIIDVKEPSRGSLGMAEVSTIAEIVSSVEACSATRRVPVSVALGETADWLDGATTLPNGVRFAKLGMAGLASRKHWERDWRSVRAAFDRVADQGPDWVAVAYADWRAADAVPPARLVAAAARSTCRVVLIDTCHKDGSKLLDWLSIGELRRLARSIRRSGIKLALAGGLTADLVAEIAALEPDIVGIRSAACRGGLRTAAVSAEAVRRFKTSLEQSFAPAMAPLLSADRAG